jgi:hypothetical protein
LEREERDGSAVVSAACHGAFSSGFLASDAHACHDGVEARLPDIVEQLLVRTAHHSLEQVDEDDRDQCLRENRANASWIAMVPCPIVLTLALFL